LSETESRGASGREHEGALVDAEEAGGEQLVEGEAHALVKSVLLVLRRLHVLLLLLHGGEASRALQPQRPLRRRAARPRVERAACRVLVLKQRAVRVVGGRPPPTLTRLGVVEVGAAPAVGLLAPPLGQRLERVEQRDPEVAPLAAHLWGARGREMRGREVRGREVTHSS